MQQIMITCIVHIIPVDLSDFTLIRRFNQRYLAQLNEFDF